MRTRHIELRQTLTIGLTGLLIELAGCAEPHSEPSAALAYPVQPFTLESAPWGEPYTGPAGIPNGAQRAVLWVDPNTNGDTYYARFPAGTRFELHWHAYAEYAVVLRGQLTHCVPTHPARWSA